MNRRVKKIGKGILIGIILTIVTLFAAVIVLFYIFFMGGPAKITRDINKYESVLSQPVCIPSPRMAEEPLVGFEPTTPRLQITCSGQLS